MTSSLFSLKFTEPTSPAMAQPIEPPEFTFLYLYDSQTLSDYENALRF